jgi:hypothetical protein
MIGGFFGGERGADWGQHEAGWQEENKAELGDGTTEDGKAIDGPVGSPMAHVDNHDGVCFLSPQGSKNKKRGGLMQKERKSKLKKG